MDKPKLITTEDGSHSLYVMDLDEHYHSQHGAVTESQYVFIEAGLKEVSGDHINIFEMGFGTGLNAFLSFIHASRSGKIIHYTGLEKYPLDSVILNSLNYASFFTEAEGKNFNLIHQVPWNRKNQITAKFSIEKILGDIDSLDKIELYDLVFYDAFSPGKQPELWSIEIFTKIFRSMKPGAILTTYSSKGKVRRNLIEAGFSVEKLSGPLRKRDMTRARKE